MLSRALSLATVTLLIGGFAAALGPAQAQNLEAGKSPAQIFAGACTACHKGPRGLLKTVSPGSLQGFLRQHYTTSPDMASLLSAYLTSNGATDTRFAGTQAKSGKDEKLDAKPGGLAEQLDRFGHALRPSGSQEAAKPDAEEAAKPEADRSFPEGQAGRHGHNARRLARTGEAPDVAKPAADGLVPGQVPALTTNERSPDGRKSAAKQRLSKRGKSGGEEPPKPDAGREEPPKDEEVRQDATKSDTAKVDSDKSDGAKSGESKPSSENKSESAGIEPPKEGPGGETPALRHDPVPPVTPAPPASPAGLAAISEGTADPVAEPSAPVAKPAPPTVTASVPSPSPIAPAGPPAPPISQ